MKPFLRCNICKSAFKASALFPFKGVCSKCSDTEPADNSLYDEETEFELNLIRNIGGRVPAVFDKHEDDSFGF